MATFRLDAPGDFETQYYGRREAEVMPSLRRAQVAQTIQQTRSMRERTRQQGAATQENILASQQRRRQEEETFPFEKVMKAVQSQAAEEELGEYLKNEETRDVLRKVQLAAQQDLLELATNNPEEFERRMTAQARFEASRADMATYQFQTQLRHNAYSQLMDVYKENGIEGANRNLEYINARYRSQTGENLFPSGTQLNLDMIGRIGREQQSLRYDLKHLQDLELAQARYGVDPRLQDASQRQAAEFVQEMVGPALANKFGFDTVSGGIPNYVESDYRDDPQAISEFESLNDLASSTINRVYQVTGDESLIREMSRGFADGFEIMQPDAPGWGGYGTFLFPTDYTIEEVEGLAKQAREQGMKEEEIVDAIKANALRARQWKADQIVNTLGLQQ